MLQPTLSAYPKPNLWTVSKFSLGFGMAIGCLAGAAYGFCLSLLGISSPLFLPAAGLALGFGAVFGLGFGFAEGLILALGIYSWRRWLDPQQQAEKWLVWLLPALIVGILFGVRWLMIQADSSDIALWPLILHPIAIVISGVLVRLVLPNLLNETTSEYL
ncbi:MAG: hypothetical protein LCH85_09945 [Chloroflexi bacterium]|nr:hypothetical protein [Chloroflexota bacterium]